MIIEPKGLWEHSAYQTDNRFILEVKPIVEDPNKLVQGTRQGYKGDKLSLNFQNVEVRAVLQVIADFTGLNIITSDSVQRQPDAAPEGHSVGPGARHHHADQGPRHAQERQCRADRAARGARARRRSSSSRRRRTSASSEPLVSESFQLNYIKAQDLLNLITTQPPAAVRRRGGPDRDHRRPGLVHFEARRGDGRSAVEHPVRAGHPVQPGGDPARSSGRSTRRSGRW